MKWPWTITVERAQNELELSEEVIKLRVTKHTLEAQLEKMEEKSARTVRELEHKTGLHRLQVEAETKIAIDKAKLEAQQSNLTADKTRFEENLKFSREQTDKQLKGMESILTSIIARLPEEKISTKTSITRGR